MAEMRRTEARFRDEHHEQERAKAEAVQPRWVSTVAISASIIAAVRLAREENISRTADKVQETVAACVALARRILQQALRTAK